jgi:hypothetical protein
MPSVLLHGYTSAQGDKAVRDSIADNYTKRFGVALAGDDLYMTCGAAASLTITLRALYEQGDEFIVIAPYFAEYRVFVEGTGAKLVVVNSDEKTLLPNFTALKNAITPHTKGVLINSPNNPSGVVYDEDTMQDYAYAQYVAEFGAPEAADAYEDNLLLVFLTNEAATDYYYIVFVGDNLRDEVSDLFGNEYTAFGRALSYEIPMDFEYSLSSDLAVVMEIMADEIVSIGLETPFYEATDHSGAVESHLTNHSALPLNEATVERGLATFTEQTGIPAVIVVDSMERVFATEKSEASGGGASLLLPILFAIALVVVAVVIVRAARRRDKGTNPADNQYAPHSNRDDGSL